MMKYKFILMAVCFIGWCSAGRAQELFVYSEPASNMPAHSIGLRLSNWLMDEQETSRLNYHMIPELMWGVNKNLMLHAEGFISNRDRTLQAEGAAVYGKYRFYSHDGLYRHFRMAAFGRISTNNADVHQEEIEINGHNSGYELGLIGTQLLHKTALSLSTSYERAMDQTTRTDHHGLPIGQPQEAINFSLSAGHLFWPKDYRNYRQVNINAMVEMIGQYHPENGHTFVDLAPAIQLIFNSQTRVDVGYKFEMTGNMQRTAPNGLLVRVEHVLFNIL